MARNIESQAKRSAHRGFIMANNAADQVISMCASNYAAKSIERRGAPLKFYWPVMSDFQGAAMLVDAVLDRDYEAVVRLNARFPEFDFQLGNWFSDVKAEYERKARVRRKVLKTRPLAHGIHFALELETDTDTGNRSLWRALYRGKKVLARDMIASEDDQRKSVETVAAAGIVPAIKPKPATRKRAKPSAPEPEELRADPALATTATTAKA